MDEYSSSIVFTACIISIDQLEIWYFEVFLWHSLWLFLFRQVGLFILLLASVSPLWQVKFQLKPLSEHSKPWASPFWWDCWVVRAAGSNAALWQLLYLNPGRLRSEGTPGSHPTRARAPLGCYSCLRIKCPVFYPNVNSTVCAQPFDRIQKL